MENLSHFLANLGINNGVPNSNASSFYSTSNNLLHDANKQSISQAPQNLTSIWAGDETFMGSNLQYPVARYPAGFNFPGTSPAPILWQDVVSQNNSVIDMLHYFTSHVSKLEGYEFVLFATSEHGSKYLQHVLMKNPKFTHDVFNKAMSSLDGNQYGIPSILHLMVDQHGWYVYGKLIDFCHDKQLALIVDLVTKDQDFFVCLCCSKHGSSSIMKLIRGLKRSPLISKLIKILADSFCTLMTDRFGQYVISECFDHININYNTLLYEASVTHFYELAKHKQGCISLNRVIEKIRGPHRHLLLNSISESAISLAHDHSGNYVVQKVIGLENSAYTEQITLLLKGHYANLSLGKTGSHLVEKCLYSRGMNNVVEDLLNLNIDQLLLVATNQFGNYVIQTALKVTKQVGSPIYLRLLTILQQYLDTYLQFGYGRNVRNLILDGIPIDHADITSSSSFFC